MKMFGRITVLFVCLAVLAGSAVAVNSTGVISVANGYVNENSFQTINNSINEWLKVYPSDGCVIDLFVPGFSMMYLRNSEEADTIDFEVVPFGDPNASLVVADIPEIFGDEYKKLVSDIKNEEEGKCSIDMSNIVRQGNSLILDCNAVADICYWDGVEYTSDYRAALYAVTVDNKSGEIVRYDFIHDLHPNGWEEGDGFSPSCSEYFDFEKERTEIVFPAGIDTENTAMISVFLCMRIMILLK